LFWTLPVPPDSVEIAVRAGRAEYALDLLETMDHHNITNSLLRGPSVPVTASFEVQWSGKKRVFEVRDAVNGFRGTFVETAAMIEWSAFEASMDFVSDPAETSTVVSALLGRERNGVFFSDTSE
jgi:hypothetical protein